MPVEWWIVFATLAGPVLAIQTQKIIERATEKRQRRLQIFAALMANRATRLNVDYIRALNLIDLVFLPRGWSRNADRAVINAWRGLFGELNHGPHQGADMATVIAWNTRCDDRLVDLLKAMSDSLGYSFSSEELRRGIYHPQANVDREQAHLAILQGLRNVLSGQASFRMAVTEFPAASPELVEAQAELARKAAAAYDNADGALKVKQIS